MIESEDAKAGRARKKVLTLDIESENSISQATAVELKLN